MGELTQFGPHNTLANALVAHLEDGADGAHDLSHILRVWANVQAIVQIEGGDLRILAAATLLHDAVLVEKDAPHRAAASTLAAERARDILAERGWDREDIEAAAHAIAAHSFSANVTPTTREAKILQDADRLDALGAIGIARCFYVAGRLGRALYDPDDPKAERRALDDSAYTLDHFHTKLLHLKESFQTPTGRALAQGRHDKMKKFLDHLFGEIGLSAD